MSRYSSNRDNNDNNTRRFTTDDEHNSRGINQHRFRDDDFGDPRRRSAGARSRRDGERSLRDGDSGSYDRQLYGRDDDPTQPGRQHPGQNRAAWDWDRDNDHRSQFGRSQDFSFDEDRGYRARHDRQHHEGQRNQGRQQNRDYGRSRDHHHDHDHDGNDRSRHLRDAYDHSGDVERHLSGYGSGGRGYSPPGDDYGDRADRGRSTDQGRARYDRDDGDYAGYRQRGQSRDYGRSSQQGGQYGQERGARGGQGGNLRSQRGESSRNESWRDPSWQDYD